MKKLLSITLSLLLIISVMVIPASAREETIVLFDSNESASTIQYGSEATYPSDGAFAAKQGWGTDKSEEHFNDGRTTWVTMENKELIFNSSLIMRDQGASVKHLVDCSNVSKDSKITFSFDFTFLNNTTSSVYFVTGLNDYQTLPFYATPSDSWIGAAGRGYGTWGSFGTGNTKKLATGIKYSFSAEYTWNETENMYDMKYEVKDGNNVELTNVITADKFKYDKDGLPHTLDSSIKALKTPDIKSITFDLTYPMAGNENYDAVDIMKIGNVKLTETKTIEELGSAAFSEACYKEPKFLIDDNMADVMPAFQKGDSGLDQYSNITDNEVLAGNKWLTEDNSAASEKTFIAEDGYLMVRPFQQKNNMNYRYIAYNRCTPKFVKCFTPITDGSGFVVKSNVKPIKTGLPKDLGPETVSQMPVGFNVQLKLTNDEHNGLTERSGNYTNSFTIFSYGINQEEKSLAAVGGVNCMSVNVNGVNSENYAAKTILSYDIDLHNKDIAVEANFVPAGSIYNVFVTCKDTEGNILLANTEPVELPKEMVADYSRFQISATFDDCVEMTDAQAAMRYMGIKDVSISSVDRTTGLENGKNTIYIPFKRTSGTYFNAAVAAAVYTGNDQTAFFLKDVKGEKAASGSIPLDITITDPDNQFVRYFVFDSFENLKSLLKNPSVLTVQRQ